MLDTGMRGQNKESRWGTGKRRRGNRDVAEPTALLLVGELRVGKSDTRAEKRQRGSGKTAWQTTTTTCTYIRGRGAAGRISQEEYQPAAANQGKRSDQQLQTKRGSKLGGSKGGKADHEAGAAAIVNHRERGLRENSARREGM